MDNLRVGRLVPELREGLVMVSSERPEVTQRLRHVESGNRTTSDRLFAAVYQQLRNLAGQFFRREPKGNTLQPTALVHEAYLKLVDQKHVDWKGQTHFFAIAAQAMRRILVDHARRRGATKRGGDRHRIALHDDLVSASNRDEDLLSLDNALTKLMKLDPRQAQMTELRFYGGLSVAEVAKVMGISTRSVEREWTMVRAWLRRELTTSDMP
jgi:RNA polymerase sigma-70 factor, ECF subfamily